jgi:hypothetical protein
MPNIRRQETDVGRQRILAAFGQRRINKIPIGFHLITDT